MNNKGKYLAFDTETGGLFPHKNPVLTAYFAVVGEDFGIIDELDLRIKPEAPFLEVDAGALEVNKIDLAKHVEDPRTVSREEASRLLVQFLKKNKPAGRSPKLRPMGHNIDFDINMIKAQLIAPETYEDLLHYGKVDTKMVIDFLKDSDWLPQDIGRLESAVRYFGITQLGAHDAKNDTLMMIEVYTKLVDILRNSKKSSVTSLDILSLLEK
jgi:DNA polymerase III alpha subunit (gram-positive type)